MAYVELQQISLASNSTQKVRDWIDTTETLVSYHKDLRNGYFHKESGSLTLDKLTVNQIRIDGVVNIKGNLIYKSNQSYSVNETTISEEEYNSHITNTDNPHKVRLCDIVTLPSNNSSPTTLENNHGLDQYAIEYGNCYTDKDRPVSIAEEARMVRLEQDNYGLIIDTDSLNPSLGAINDSNKSHLATNKAIYNYFESRIDDIITTIYPIGSIYINVSNSENPSTFLGIGVWSRIGAGRTLMTTSSTYTAGSFSDSSTRTMTADNIPSHTHTGSTNSTGAHTHSRGSWNITGSVTSNVLGRHSSDTSTDGALYKTNGSWSGKDHHGGACIQLTMNANWVSDWGQCASSGSHTHTGSSSDDKTNASPTSFSIVQPYISAFIWRRTA